MLRPRRQHPPHVQIPDIDRLVRLSRLLTARQHIHLRARIGRQEEREGVPLAGGGVAHAVDGRAEAPTGLQFEVLAHVADEGSGEGGRGDPVAGLVEDLESWGVVLEDEGEPLGWG